ncbi:hypothetical protein [Luteolibacter sp.]
MSAKKSVRGKRYSDSEKAEVIAFVEKHDAANGRGGKSAAAKQFGITPVTLGAWMKGGGKGKKAGKRQPKTVGTGGKSTGPSTGGSFSQKVKELTDLAGQIDKAQAALAKLRQRFDALKAAL